MVHSTLFRFGKSKTYTAKLEMGLENWYISHIKALIRLHLLQFCLISGANSIHRFFQKCKFFSKQHGQKTCSGKSMENILKSRYRISKLTRVFKRPFASFQWSFWPQEYTLNAWKGLDLFLQKIFLYFLYILFSFSKIVTYYASHKM